MLDRTRQTSQQFNPFTGSFALWSYEPPDIRIKKVH